MKLIQWEVNYKMATKRLKPDTPSRRFNVVPTFEEITKSKPERTWPHSIKDL